MRLLFVGMLIFSSQTIFAGELPAKIELALAKYKQDGVENFIPEILKDSPLEGNKALYTQSNMIKQIEAFYGKMESYEFLTEFKVTDKVRDVYYMIYYENGPVYGKATMYLNNGKEVVISFNVHTDRENIIPDYILEMKR